MKRMLNMASRHLTFVLTLLVLTLVRPDVTASPSAYRSTIRHSPPTVNQALAYVDRETVVTKEQFQFWTGLRPRDGRFATWWRLADGVLVTNYMELAPGRLAIACWQVEKR